VLGVVRCEEDVKVGIERACWQLHEQQRTMHRQGYQYDCEKWN
jgi:hypothetical protein